MAEYVLTDEADLDLEEIYEYSFINFGEAQADKYFLELHNTFRLLAENPNLGHSAEQFRTGLRCFEYGSHIVFYLSETGTILIGRILHQKVDVKRWL